MVVCHGLEVEGLDPPGEARQELQAGGVAGSEREEKGDFFPRKIGFSKFSAELCQDGKYFLQLSYHF